MFSILCHQGFEINFVLFNFNTFSFILVLDHEGANADQIFSILCRQVFEINFVLFNFNTCGEILSRCFNISLGVFVLSSEALVV